MSEAGAAVGRRYEVAGPGREAPSEPSRTVSEAGAAVGRRYEVAGPDADRIAQIAGAVVDPELPMVSIADLGVLRGVRTTGDAVTITITPTYSGCPALQAISDDIVTAVRSAGYSQVAVQTRLSPAWSSDDISPAGRRALDEAGIAPPAHRASGPVPLTLSVRCPQCGSRRTEQLSRFGSTSCKALYRCRDCAEPFDYVKVL